MAQNKVISFVKGNCPNCGKGKVFKFGLYSHKYLAVNHECEHCKFKFEPEPGFYYGAMYFTYAINVGLIITLLVFFNIAFEKFNPLNFVITIITIVLLGFNIIGRISRLLMLFLFGDPRA